MTPVNAMNQIDDDELRHEPASGKASRPSVEAAELAWMLRGSQAEPAPSTPLSPVPDEDEAAILEALVAVRAESAAAASVPPAPIPAPGHNSQNAALAEGEEPAQRRDWSSALDLVQEACEAIRISEERVQDLERQGQQASLQAREDIKALQLQIQAGERRAQAAEARATKAEARALEAESWLARLHDAIVMGFGRSPKSGDL